MTLPLDDKALPPVLALPAVAAVLRRLGFRLAHRSRSGSRYLALPGVQFWLRLSDHHRRGFARRRKYRVVHDVVVAAVDPREIDGVALEIALGFVLRARIRTGQLGEVAA